LPEQLYEKEHILDACLSVFARHGYEKTTTAMLAEAAGISKALIFHHFKSKKALYLQVLDRCFELARIDLDMDTLFEEDNFFEAREKRSLIKLDYYKQHPDMYNVVKEAFQSPPAEIKSEIEAKYGEIITERNKLWKQLFAKVPLREGVDREQAYELINAALEHFEKKYSEEINDKNEFDEAYVKRLLEERTRLLDMIRFGIER
jgi:TetR/AcrR family transcriptional regulator